MYSVTNEVVAERIESYSRTWRIILDFGDKLVMGDNIITASSDIQSTSLSDDIELGAVCAQTWDLQLSDLDLRFLGDECDLYFYLVNYDHGATTYGDLEIYTWGELSRYTVQQVSRLGEILANERIPMGHFVCVRSKRTGRTTTLTLADKLYFSDKPYVPGISFPATAHAVENDICSQLGVENGNDYTLKPYLFDCSDKRLYDSAGKRLRATGFDFTIRKSQIPDGATMRQVLSYIASAHGQFGYIDRFGKYMRKWYGQSVKTLDLNTIDLPTLSEQLNVVTGICCHVSGDTDLSYGDSTGRVLEFENPFMTEMLLQSLWFRVKGYAWYTTELFHRLGDPRLDIGDVITYEPDESSSYDIPITSLDFNFDGGLSADISAVGINVEEQIEPI